MCGKLQEGEALFSLVMFQHYMNSEASELHTHPHTRFPPSLKLKLSLPLFRPPPLPLISSIPSFLSAPVTPLLLPSLSTPSLPLRSSCEWRQGLPSAPPPRTREHNPTPHKTQPGARGALGIDRRWGQDEHP